jgi:hypothetical protein
MRFNSDSGSNYSATILGGDGSSAYSARRTNSTSVICNYFDFLNSTTATQYNISIQNYSNATTYKPVLVRANRADQATEAIVGIWRATPAAITQIDLTPSSSSFATGSTFTIYGIAAAAPYAASATGGTITYSVEHVYHTFTSSGTFTPSTALTADVLVVAGGGGGGFNLGGGGGAGGLVYSTVSIPASAQTITVGAAGAGGILSTGTKATNGSNSSIASLAVAIGGGAGGSSAEDNHSYQDGASGGSGGGGTGYYSNATNPGGAGTSGQGYAGGSGTGNKTPPYGNANTGGGGGAGEAGTNGGTVSTWAGGKGGNGLYYDSFGSLTGTGHNTNGHYYYAGGGGGSGLSGTTQAAGGYGGGGIGGVDGGADSSAGTANTGGGGGGSRGNGTDGKAGGSGIVIIRYAR